MKQSLLNLVNKLCIPLLLFIVMPSIFGLASATSTNVILQPKLLGGFSAPEFFTSYDEQRVNIIAANKTAKVIQISYPLALKQLAQKIAMGIMAQSTVKVELKEVDLKDTSTLKYRHDAVIVVLYFRDSN